MDLTPTAYESWAKVISKYSDHLIDNIKNQNKSYSNVVDIGSGLGNISSLLFEKLRIENHFGIDVDHKMINFANRHRTNARINFLLQDISEDWSSLRPELKALEGKVDLIFSSFVLQFITNIPKAAENISKLLAPGGQLQTVAFCLTDSLHTQTNGKGTPMKVPTAQEQVNLWTDALKQAGLKVEQVKLFKFEETVPPMEAEVYYQAVSVCYKLFLTEELDHRTEESLINKAKEKLMENSYKFVADMNDTKLVRVESDIYTLKVTKDE